MITREQWRRMDSIQREQWMKTATEFQEGIVHGWNEAETEVVALESKFRNLASNPTLRRAARLAAWADKGQPAPLDEAVWPPGVMPDVYTQGFANEMSSVITGTRNDEGSAVGQLRKALGLT